MPVQERRWAPRGQCQNMPNSRRRRLKGEGALASELRVLPRKGRRRWRERPGSNALKAGQLGQRGRVAWRCDPQWPPREGHAEIQSVGPDVLNLVAFIHSEQDKAFAQTGT